MDFGTIEKLVCDFQAADGYASVRIESNEKSVCKCERPGTVGNLHRNRGLIKQNQLVPVEFFMLIDKLRMDTQDKNRIFG